MSRKRLGLDAYARVQRQLSEAIASGNVSAVRSLVRDEGARVDQEVPFVKREGTIPPLQWAILNVDVDMLRFICMECNCHPSSNSFQYMTVSPLYRAVCLAVGAHEGGDSARYENCKACIDVLLQAGADPRVATEWDIAPLKEAACCKDLHDFMRRTMIALKAADVGKALKMANFVVAQGLFSEDSEFDDGLDDDVLNMWRLDKP